MSTIGGFGPDPLSASQLKAGERVAGSNIAAVRQQKDLEKSAQSSSAGDVAGKLKAKETEHTHHHAESVELSEHATHELDQDEQHVAQNQNQTGQTHEFLGQDEVHIHHHHSHGMNSKDDEAAGAMNAADQEKAIEEAVDDGEIASEAEDTGMGGHKDTKTRGEIEAENGLWEEMLEKEQNEAGLEAHQTVQNMGEGRSGAGPRTDMQKIEDLASDLPREIHHTARTMVANQIQGTQPGQSLKELKRPDIKYLDEITAVAPFTGPLESIHDTGRFSGPLQPELEESFAA